MNRWVLGVWHDENSTVSPFRSRLIVEKAFFLNGSRGSILFGTPRPYEGGTITAVIRSKVALKANWCAFDLNSKGENSHCFLVIDSDFLGRVF